MALGSRQRLSEDQLRAALRAAEEQDTNEYRSDYELAVNYFEGRQIRDVQSELQQRYRNAQMASKGEKIAPIAIPLTQRYVAEAASIYNRPFSYKLVKKSSGEFDGDATKKLNDHLNSVGYWSALQLIDSISVLTQTAGRWDQIRRGGVRPRAIVPNQIYPVPDSTVAYPDQTDPDDYLGFVVQLTSPAKGADRNAKHRFVLITHDEHIYYRSESWHTFEAGSITRWANPFSWQQEVDVMQGGLPTGRSQLQSTPLQMMTFWHARKPIDEILIQSDADIAVLNREINVVWSVIVDIIRTQTHGQMVFNTLDKNNPPARIPYGPRFALSLDTEEKVSFETVSHNYTDVVRALQAVTGLYAIAKRLSPNDFLAIENKVPSSGFAKLVDSLPRIEARQERVIEQRRKQEQEVWPRLGAQMKFLGIIPNAEEYDLRAEATDLRFPRTADEEIKASEFSFKHGLDSPAAKLAREREISIDEAQAIIDENKEDVVEEQKVQVQIPVMQPVGAPREPPMQEPGARAPRLSDDDEARDS